MTTVKYNDLSESEKLELIEKAKDWALANGISMRSKSSFCFDSVSIAPFTLFPSPFPEGEFKKALRLQTSVNELIHRVAYDYEFLKATLSKTLEGDEFTRNLFWVYEEVRKCPSRQKLSLGLLRTDYMCDPDSGIKQVETNTISSSFSALSCKLTSLHKYVLCEIGCEDLTKDLPLNDAVTNLAKGMLEACRRHSNPEGAILVVVEELTVNICDQRLTEYAVKSLEPSRKILRRKMSQLRKQASLGPKGELFVEGEEIALVYFRSCYTPEQHAGLDDWNVRLLLEKSMAVKCPSIEYHLAGTKKVQQVLSQPGTIERFIKNADAVRTTFVEMYSLDPGPEGDKGMKEGVSSPFRFVLKPQREGGGNNLYDEAIPAALSRMSEQERGGWVLMERIRPSPFDNVIVRPQQTVAPAKVTSELGIYGVVIGDSEAIHYNQVGGHVLRTKGVFTNEGGIVGGTGSLDSPLLT